MTYENVIEIRQEFVDGETNWHWIKTDRGAFDGPKNDWENSHKERYFQRLKNRRVCVTAGGNCGMYTRLYSKMFDVVYVFEPDPLNFHCLVNNNQVDNVVKINTALGEKPGFAGIVRQTMGNVGMHKMGGSGFTPIMPLDSYNFPVLDFLQLDVEGFEPQVLKGAEATINRCKPIIVVEGNKCHDILRSFGYFHLTNSGHADQVFLPR